MWFERTGATRWRLRPPSERWRDAKLSPKDEQRIAEIRRSFEEKGWRLFVEQEERHCWVAWFFQEELGPSLNDVVRKRTAVAAALAALAKSTDEPPLRRKVAAFLTQERSSRRSA